MKPRSFIPDFFSYITYKHCEGVWNGYRLAGVNPISSSSGQVAPRGLLLCLQEDIINLFWATRRDQIMVNLQDYKEKLDYGHCVAVIAYASLREMIKPGALTIISPMIIRWLIACHLNLLLLLISLSVK
ncbi:hypothetical protein NC652_034996 [Populus alba x Populus x berolinensis]|nr:hypothetical protein NC652_034996 [Populus alba x Populus x berolinensis]